MRWLIPIVVAALGCTDDPRRRTDLDEVDAAVSTDAGRDDRGPRDAAAPPDGARDARIPDAGPDVEAPDGRVDDAEVADAAIPDAAPDQALDGAVDAAPDGPPDLGDPDAGGPDGADPDGASPDAALPDAAPPDLGEPGGFVVGAAAAADQRLRVRVAGGGAETQSDDGRFRLGPVRAGRVTLAFSAAGHQTETVEIEVPAEGEVALEEPVLLYRGRRLTPRQAGRLIFRFDDAWLLWETEQRLEGTALEPIAVRTLVEEDHEVFLGFVPGVDAVAARRRTVPGLAGDIDYVPLDGEPAENLFVEAQPWVRWIGGDVLGMVQTRDALSRLEVTQVGAAPRALAEGVPWLLVVQLADDRVAWAQGDAPDFDVYVSGLDPDAEPTQVSPVGGPSGDEFLATTPGRGGLMWLTPEGGLWTWTPDEGAVLRAAEVLPSPRPRFLADGRLLVWRADAVGAALFVVGDDERQLVGEAASNTFLQVGETFYVVQPEAGLFYGAIDGPPGRVILPGEGVRAVSSNGGVIAVVDGVAHRHRGDGDVERLGGEALTNLRGAPNGATAFQVEGGVVWYLAGPGFPPAADVLLRGAPRLAQVSEPGNGALYLLGEAGYLRVALPPGDAPDVTFDVASTGLTPLDADRLLAQDGAAKLWQVDPQTGAAFGWAEQVTRVTRSSRRGYVAYVCDRGVFLVDLEP